MATLEELMNIEPEDISTATQAIICFCLDTSLSMLGNRIKTLNSCVERFIKENSSDVFNSNITNVCIVSFGGIKPKLVQKFDNIKNISFTKMVSDGSTHMAAGVKMAINEILSERKKWEDRGTGCYKPILVIMSDGKADDDLRLIAKETTRLISDGKLKTLCVGFDIENDELAKKDLQMFSPNKPIYTANEFSMENFFQELSRSVSNTSRQFAGEIEDF